MIGFCTVADIRGLNSRLTADRIIDSKIETQIENAENIIIADLSSLYSESDLTSAVGAKALRNLCIYKAMELCLVYLHGFTREVDTTTDVDYWMKKYDDYLKRILSGEIIIEVGGDDFTPISIPKVKTSGITEIFDTRGIEGFDPDYDSNIER